MDNVKEFAVPTDNTLDIDDLLALPSTADEVVEKHVITGWGEIKLGSLTADQMTKWSMQNDASKEGKRTGGLRLLALCLVGKNGRRLKESEIPAAIEQLKIRNTKSVDEALEHCMRITGLKVPQSAVKNASGETNSDASPTS